MVEDDINPAYKKLTKAIDAAARISLGKTTLKNTSKRYVSDEIKRLRHEKKMIQHELKSGTCNRPELILKVKEIQIKLQNEILAVKTDITNRKFKEMIADKSKRNYWKATKKINRNSTNECLTVKNKQGKREYNPDNIKDTVADHYEDLYKAKAIAHHSHHEKVESDIKLFQECQDYENEWYNLPPSTNEILEVIRRKKNGKATTDFKNKMLKGCDITFARLITPVMQTAWIKECIPIIWNEGIITSLWEKEIVKISTITEESQFLVA